MEGMEDISVKEECEETPFDHEFSTSHHGFEEILIKEEPESEDSNNQFQENCNKDDSKILSGVDTKKKFKYTDTEIKYFRCNFCNKSFTEKFSLKCHMTTHIGKKEFECNICHQLFPNNNTLKYHLNTHVDSDANKSKDYQCSLCHKSFSKYGLKYHMIAHDGIKQFQCPTCRKSFMTKYSLMKHSDVHKLSDQENICTICNKSFKHKKTLVCHVRAHLGIKDFKCTKCDKSFAAKSYLTRHFKLHLLNDRTPMQMQANSTESSKDNNLTVENIEDIFVKDEEFEIKPDKHELDKTIVSEISNNKFQGIKEQPKTDMDSEDYNEQKDKQCNDLNIIKTDSNLLI